VHQRLGGHRGELGGQRVDAGGKGVVGHRLPDQAPLGGLLGGQLVGQQRQAHRPGHADALGQEPGAAGVGHQADLAEGLQEGGRLAGHHQVAGQRHAGAGAGGDAVDGGDGRHAQVLQAQDQRLVVGFDHVADVRHLAAHGLHVGVGQILAGAEGAAGAGEHQHADGLVGLDGVEGGAQLGVHLAGEAVELVRAVEREAGDAVGNLKNDSMAAPQTW
jgi:hypothetical protein